MSDKPILFKTPMVKALIAGKKTQTRRILTNVPPPPGDTVHARNLNLTLKNAPYLDSYCSEPRTSANPRGMSTDWCWWTRDDRCGSLFKVKYAPGDRLWIREAWAHDVDIVPFKGKRLYYRADVDFSTNKTVRQRSSIHMPRWASRITLTVTDVRVERVQSISEEDARAEGAISMVRDDEGEFYENATGTAVCGFAGIWAHIHGPGAWDTNPWVGAYTFAVSLRNIDDDAATASEAA